MQLLLVLALLLYGGKSGPRELLEEVKPVLETIGGDEISSALKSAEEIADVLSAVSAMVPAAPNSAPAPDSDAPAPDSFPLAPVNNIMDENISRALNKYIQTPA